MSHAIAKSGGSDFEIAPAGLYIARCFRVLYIGTQPKVFKGIESGSAQKIIASFELLSEKIKRDDGTPYQIHQEYTLSINKRAKLAQHLEAWFGGDVDKDYKDGFDCEMLVGKYCRMQIGHKTSESGNTYAVILALMGLAEEDTKPAPFNPDVFFDVLEPDMEVFKGLSQYYRDLIEKAEEWALMSPQSHSVAPLDDDDPNKPIDLSGIPF
jgi:hypothetical protein